MVVKWAERTLWLLGCVALGYFGLILARGAYEQKRGDREFGRMLTEYAETRKAPTSLAPGSLVGRLQIRRLNLSAVVFEGTNESTLTKGIGHLTGSAMPDAQGNVVLAAHRDTFFRPLKEIEYGDTVILETPEGSYRYVVDNIGVVKPSATEVLYPTESPTLTLITCYPFSYVGSAPERFVVRARLESPRF
jgi:sortase A